MKNKLGFTLIELLIVIAVMAILTTVVFVALNPLARFQDSRNSKRSSDVEAIIGAIKINQVDNGGYYLQAIEDAGADLAYQIGTGSSCDEPCLYPAVALEADCVDLAELVTKGTLPKYPFDPQATGASAEHSKYYLIKNSNGSITVGSCAEEKGSTSGATPAEISVTR